MPAIIVMGDCFFTKAIESAGTTAATARPCLVMIVVGPWMAALRSAGSCLRACSAPVVWICLFWRAMPSMYRLYGTMSLSAAQCNQRDEQWSHVCRERLWERKSPHLSTRAFWFLKAVRELLDARFFQQFGYLPGFGLGQRTGFFNHHGIAMLEFIVRRMRMVFL